ncbi:cation diffusion facilitator family transporter [Proteiniclasticum sp. C24MP]|uniref:cation diffusion facilitator family transporter n=1 Tax=Proteiniclasticum sp. C24MP TaxID=3374101 RepID=UPI0037542527
MINKMIDKVVDGRDFQVAKERERIGRISGMLGILLNFILFAVKGLLGLFTGSIALIADAFNNLTDTASSVITIIGFKMAGKEPDKEHPYGHGRIEYLTGLTISVLIIVVGYQFVVSSFKKILSPSPVTSSPLIIAILVLSLSFKLFIYYFNKRLGKKVDSSTLLATAQDAIGDVLTTSVVILGLILSQYTALPVDGFIGVLIALYIIFSGLRLSLETINPILGEKPEKELADKIKKRVLSYEHIHGVHDLQIHNYGPAKTMATIDVEVPHDMNLVELHNVVDKIERHIREDLNISLVIHVDPINYKDERYMEVKKIVGDIALGIDNIISFHDFRYTGHSEDELIILEVVVDSRNTSEKDRSEIRKELEEKLHQRFKTARIMITVDLDVAVL